MPELASAALLGTLGIVGAGAAAGANYGLTKRARKENYMYNEMAADSAFERQTQMQKFLNELQYKQYYDLESPKAIIKQLKEAGLSPSIYAQNAVGGNVSGVSTSGSAPQGAGAAGLNYPAITPIDFASINLAAAQADKAEEEANALRGENPKGAADIEKIVAETLGIKASKRLTELNADIAEIRRDIDKASKDDVLNTIYYKSIETKNNAERLRYEAISSNAASQITTETINDNITYAKLKNEVTRADALLKKSLEGLNQANVDKIANECEKWREELLQKWVSLNFEEARTKSYGQYVESNENFQRAEIEKFVKEIKLASDKLELDKDMQEHIQKYDWYKLATSIYLESSAQFTKMVTALISLGK